MPDGYSPGQLRQMDDETARQTLTVEQYERREKLIELHEDVDTTEDALEAEVETVADLTVHADPEALGTRVDIFGNDLLVRVNPEDDDVRDVLEALREEADGHDDVPIDDAVEELDSEAVERLGDRLLALLDAALVKWGEAVWADLPEQRREALLSECREKWGLDGLVTALGSISEAVQEDRQQGVDTVEKFRDPERRGDR